MSDPLDPPSFSLQLRTALLLNWLLLRRNPSFIIVSIVVPIIFIGAAAGMVFGINQSLPKLPKDLNFPLSLNQTISGIRNPAIGAIVLPQVKNSDPFFRAFDESLKTYLPFQFINSSVPEIASFDSISNLIESNMRADKDKSMPYTAFAYMLNSTFRNDSNPIAVRYNVVVDSKAGTLAVPAMVSVVGQSTQARFSRLASLITQQPDMIIIVPNVGTFNTPFRLDVGGSLIPAFFTNAAGIFISFFAVPQVQFREQGFHSLLSISGLTPLPYYLGAFIVDLLSFYFSMIVSYIITYSFSLPFFVKSFALAYILPILLIGPVFIVIAYILSFLFKKEGSVGPILGIGTSVVIFVPYFIVVFVYDNKVDMIVDLVVGGIIPTYGLFRVLDDVANAQLRGLGYSSFKDIVDWRRMLGPMCFVFVLDLIVYGCVLWGLVSWRSRVKLGKGKVEDAEVGEEDMDEEVKREMERLQVDEYILKVEGLRKSYFLRQQGKHKELKVLRDLYLGVKHNECFGFLGPNGAGKSTAIKILTGLEPSTSGTASIASFPVCPTFTPTIRRYIGLCPQQNVLFPNLTPSEHLKVFGMLRNVSDDEIQKMRSVFDVEEKKVKSLSGGNQRKVMVMVAMVGKPRVVFLDEPTTGVDVVNRRIIWDVIKDLKKDCAIVLTTHSMEEAEALSDRIGIMINGKLRCLGAPQRLKSVYGAGYKINFRTTTEEQASQLSTYFPTKIIGSKLVHVIGCNLQFEVDRRSGGGAELLGRVFKEIEEECKQQYGVLEYAVSQTTLAQVFIELAKEQIDF